MRKEDEPAVVIRSLAAGDLDAVDAILMAAYASTRSMRSRLARCLVRPDATFVAFDGDRPIGFVCANDYVNAAYVALMGVEPAAHSRGVGRSLLRRLLAWADARGLASLELDATPSGAPLYVSEGFIDDGETIVFEGVTTGGMAPRDAMSLTFDRDAIFRADRAAFGADRRGALEPLLDDASSAVFVAADDGYSVAQNDAIGPVVATRPDVAEALFSQALSACAGDTVRVCIPSANEDAVAIAQGAGLEEQRRLRHMLRGAPIVRPVRGIFARINLGQG